MKRKAHPGVFLDGGGGDFFAHTGSGFFFGNHCIPLNRTGIGSMQ